MYVVLVEAFTAGSGWKIGAIIGAAVGIGIGEGA